MFKNYNVSYRVVCVCVKTSGFTEFFVYVTNYNLWLTVVFLNLKNLDILHMYTISYIMKSLRLRFMN